VIEQPQSISEKNLRAFFGAIDDLIFIATPEGKVLYINDTVTRKLGYSAEEMEKLGILGVHPQEKQDEARCIFAAMLRGEQHYCPLPLVRKDGSLLPVETRVWFGKWNDEKAVFGMSKDLNKEQESLQKFIKIFEKNPVLMAITSFPQREYVDINQALLKYLGYSKQELIGVSAKKITLFADPKQQEYILDQIKKEKKITQYEMKMKDKYGRLFDGLYSGEFIESQGKTYILSVVTDISERKRTEEELARVSARLALATRAGGVGVWDYDVLNNFLIWDDQMFALYGVDKKDFSYAFEAWRAGVHPEDVERGDREVEMALKGEKEFDTEFRVVHPNGEVRNIRAPWLFPR